MEPDQFVVLAIVAILATCTSIWLTIPKEPYFESTPTPTPEVSSTPTDTITPSAIFTPRPIITPRPTPMPTPTPEPFLKWCDESGACYMGRAPDPTPIPTPTPSPTPVITPTPKPTPPVRIVGGIPVGRVNFGSVGGSCNATLEDEAERYYLEHCGGIIADRNGLGDWFSLSWCVVQPGAWAEECRHCVMERECYNITEFNSTLEH